MRYLLLINNIKILLFLAGFSSYPQTIILKGEVTDSLQNPLYGVNLLAVSDGVKQDASFAITDSRGGYRLKLRQNQHYTISLSHMGFKPKTTLVTTTDQNITINFKLLQYLNPLDEVILVHKIPVIIKKDTIVYDVSHFATGKERKLREILKKLPGVEVDNQGIVSVNGRKITKVLVEDDLFFTGNSKLAVNNIPADAVDKVEVLGNYNSVAMLNGLQDSDEMALNIKLKLDKKKFAFGDIEVGGGVKSRYVVHPSLFFYSPKTSLNFIADLSNHGDKNFTVRDYLEYEGGFGKLFDSPESYFSLLSSDFARYLNNEDYTDNTNRFGALSVRQSVSGSTDISAYVISSDFDTETFSNSLNLFQNTTIPLTEERNIGNSWNNFFSIGKIAVTHSPSLKENIAYEGFLKLSTNNSDGLITSLTTNRTNDISTLTNIKLLDVRQNVNYTRKWSEEHTINLEANYNLHNNKPIREWITNMQILQGLIPLKDDNTYNIIQTKKSNLNNFNATLKDYWELNNYNHIYTSLSVSTSMSEFFNKDVQHLSDGSINNFNSVGFGNDTMLQFYDVYTGIEYKFQVGKITFKPSLFYHKYLWRINQFNQTNTFHKSLFSPQFDTKIEFSNSEKLNFKYSLNARFPKVNQLANNFVLSSFNSVYKGNENLENQLYHKALLSYFKFNLLKGLSLNLSAHFIRRIETIRINSKLYGIESFNTPTMSTSPENNWIFNGGITKNFKRIKYKINGRYAHNDFYQLLSSNAYLNTSKSISSTMGIETKFDNYPNVELNYTKDLSNYKGNMFDNNFENDRLEIDFEYNFLKYTSLKAEYVLDNYKNINNRITNTFETTNMSLFHQKEDSPWSFELNATNLFDVRFKQKNTFNTFLITDNKTFILPRIIMFKLMYNF